MTSIAKTHLILLNSFNRNMNRDIAHLPPDLVALGSIPDISKIFSFAILISLRFLDKAAHINVNYRGLMI